MSFGRRCSGCMLFAGSLTRDCFRKSVLVNLLPRCRQPEEQTSMAHRRHRWSKSEDLVAFYISRYGDSRLPKRQQEIAKILGMTEASLIMRRQNFASLDGKGGLDHA